MQISPPGIAVCRFLAPLFVVWMTTCATGQVVVELDRLDGTHATGRLAAISAGEVRLSTPDGDVAVARDEVTALRVIDVSSESLPPIAATGWTVLATGDQLRLQPLVVDDVSLLTKWSRFPALPPLAVPLEVCRGVAFKLPADPLRQGHVFRTLMEREDESDLIVLRNGDRIEGEFVELANGKVVVETSLGEVSTELNQAESLAFNPDLISIPESDGPVTTLVLRDGSTLWASAVQADEDQLLVEAVAGFKVGLPVGILRTIQFFGPRCRSLATLPTTRQEIKAFLTTRRPPRRGRNVVGSPLSIRGRRFATGIGVSSGTSLTWSLESNAELFNATVGIDDAADGQGSVVFEVLLDGTSVWKSQRMTGRDRAIETPMINVAGAAELTLQTHFSDRGHVLDFADWCDPVLIGTR